ncbi:MAG: STAS domain-containing protein [Thermoleophilaceae bacterium]
MAHLTRATPNLAATIAAPRDQTANGSRIGLPPGAVRTTTRRAGVQVIALEGEFDLSNATQLDLAVDEAINAGARDFIIDLREVDFLDGATMHALVRGWKQVARRNGRFVLVAPPNPIWRLFVLTGLSRTFARFATLQEAITHIAAVQERRSI